MSKKIVYSLSIIALLFTVPRWSSSSVLIYGFPAWAIYTLVSIAFYSVIIAFLLQYHWQIKPDKKD